MPREIRIDPEFQSLIPPLSADERSLLEASVAREGVRDALSVWDRDDDSILLDGHNRHCIATRLDVAYDVVAVPGIETRDDAVVWIIRNQLGRRNLTDFVKVELAMRMATAVEAKAKSNMVKGGGDKRSGLINRSDPITPILTRQEIAKAAGVSMGTVERVRVIKARGVPELQDAARTGDIAPSAGARLAALPADEQRAIVAKGAEASRAKSTELRMASRPSEPESESDDDLRNPPIRTASPATIALDEKVATLVADGFGTGDIAKELGVAPHNISESKRRLGLTRTTSGNPLMSLTEQAERHAAAWDIAIDALQFKARSSTQEQRVALSAKLVELVKAARRLMSVLAKSEEGVSLSC